MPIQFSDTVRNARADAIETAIGPGPTLEIRTAPMPANCAAADVGAALAILPLSADWMADAAAGVKAMLGTWQDSSADAAGTAAHFRVKSSGGACGMQGTVTATGGGGDMTVDNVVFAAGQSFSVTSFAITEGNA